MSSMKIDNEEIENAKYIYLGQTIKKTMSKQKNYTEE